MRLDDKDRALQWLYQDEMLNLMSIDMLERDLVRIEFAGEASLLLINDQDYMIHCRRESEWPELAGRLLAVMSRDHFIILRAHEKWYLEDLMEKTGFTDMEPYLNSLYPDDFLLQGPVPDGLAIRPLTMAEFPFVRETYLTVDDDDYIRSRIEEGMLGAWYQGELAGFIGTHQEGTVGLLEVLPKYRRKGIARALETQMHRILRQQGRRAFGTIAAGNQLSLTVHRKMGIRLASEPVYWLFPPEY